MKFPSMESFADELVKIALPAALTNLAERAGGLKALKIPAVVGGSVLGWEQLKKFKRRYDIGKQVEEMQGG